MTTKPDRRRISTREVYSWAEIVGFAVTAAIVVLLMALATGAI